RSTCRRRCASFRSAPAPRWHTGWPPTTWETVRARAAPSPPAEPGAETLHHRAGRGVSSVFLLSRARSLVHHRAGRGAALPPLGNSCPGDGLLRYGATVPPGRTGRHGRRTTRKERMLPAQTPPRRVRRGVSPPDRGRSRRLRAAVAGATALALLLTGSAASASPGAAADPSGLASATTPYGTLTASQLAELGSRGNGVVELTLITGDRVRVSLADGRPVVRGIVPAHRDGGPDVAFYTLTRGDRVYVVPSDAAGLVAQDVLDLELFNLAELAELAAHGTVGEVPVIVTHERRVTARVGSSPVDGATVERILPSIQATAQRIDGD